METLDLMVAGACAVFAHAGIRLWRNRRTAGVVPCLLLFVALTAYLLSVVHSHPPLLALQAGYVGCTLVPPLLFTAAAEYARLPLPGWRQLRWLVAPLVGIAAVANLATDHQGLMAAIAGEPDLMARADHIRQARVQMMFSTTWLGYGFALATVAVATHGLATSPGQRREMLALVLMPLLVVLTDAAHFLTGFTVAGAMPTPFAMVGGVVLTTAVLYRTSMFDLRPIARSMLTESVMDGMVVVNARHRVVDCNAAVAAMLGLPADVLLGSRAEDVLPREFTAMLQSTVQLRSELQVRSRHGASWMEVDVTPLAVRRRPAGHLLIARDITERRVAQQALEESRRALEAANARLVEQSITDPLTGLKNRRFLFQRLNEEMNRHHRSGAVLGLLVVDLDHFKTVNDTHGHPEGDDALVQVAASLIHTVRDCDVVARLGGEEFAVLAVNTDAEGLEHLAERIRRAIARITVAAASASPIRLSASIGVACAGPESRTVEGLFGEADRNLYRAKHQGRNRVVGGRAGSQVQQAG